MILYGTMQSYDRNAASGWVLPDDSAQAIAFDRADQVWVHHTALLEERYRFELRRLAGGEQRAVNLQLIQTRAERAAVRRADLRP